MQSLRGYVALVTGGGRGIGRAIALRLADAGAAVAVTGRSLAHLEETVAAIAASGGQAVALPGDVGEAASVQAVVDATRAALGPIDILVNNAGVTASVKFVETDDATWEQIMRVNVTGPFYYCRAVIPDMLTHGGGRIINIASIAALTGLAYSAPYSASKHALLGLTRSLAIEYLRAGITCNAICPGWTESDMLDATLANIAARTGRTPAQARQILLGLSNQKQYIQPEQVAAIALELALPEAAERTGEAIELR